MPESSSDFISYSLLIVSSLSSSSPLFLCVRDKTAQIRGGCAGGVFERPGETSCVFSKVPECPLALSPC